MGAEVSRTFRELKACSHSKVQVKVTPFSVSQCNDFAMINKLHVSNYVVAQKSLNLL